MGKLLEHISVKKSCSPGNFRLTLIAAGEKKPEKRPFKIQTTKGNDYGNGGGLQGNQAGEVWQKLRQSGQQRVIGDESSLKKVAWNAQSEKPQFYNLHLACLPFMTVT